MDTPRSSEEIHHVSDTALWVAVYRAEESERPDAVFRDPLARVLAGERGQKIAESMSARDLMRWVMVIRTVAIDRLIEEAIAKGADTVINLGAGLDTRPYRMKLPRELRWIEVDFEHMIELKNTRLAGEKPVCRLERVALDLSRRQERNTFFEKIASGSKRIAIVTEGVIPYLRREDAAELASDLRDVPSFQFWIQDFYQGSHSARVPFRWRRKLKSAPFKFAVKDWFEFFGAFGWKPEDVIYGIDQAALIDRWPVPTFFRGLYMKFAPAFLRRRTYENIRRRFGYVLMKSAQ